MRLVRTLSSFLSLPKVISYQDLEDITEKLLEEPHLDTVEYSDVVDFSVTSPRDTSKHGKETNDPLWKRRESNPIGSLELSADPADIELQQRKLFVEANRLNRLSKSSFGFSSSKSLKSRTSVRRLGSNKSIGSMSTLGAQRVSHRSMLSSTNDSNSLPGAIEYEDGEDVIRVEDDTLSDMTGTTFEEMDGELDEEEYMKWRTEVKEEYLAWIHAKLEAKRRRKSKARRASGKKPRWLLLYEASKRTSLLRRTAEEK